MRTSKRCQEGASIAKLWLSVAMAVGIIGSSGNSVVQHPHAAALLDLRLAVSAVRFFCANPNRGGVCVRPLRFGRFLKVRFKSSGDLALAIPNRCSASILDPPASIPYVPQNWVGFRPVSRVAKKQTRGEHPFPATAPQESSARFSVRSSKVEEQKPTGRSSE